MKNNRPTLIFAGLFYFLLLSQYLAAQGQAISGTVTDALGPIPGVHILIKGQHSGTFSDQNGRYQLIATPSDTLVFTYLGYKTVELPVGSHTQINVQLKEDVTALQEVEVNAGYYTVKERERTGNISKVTAEEIELQPIVSPLEALQGRMAGVEVVQQSGVPGSAPLIRIRGQNSLRSEGNYPLYIIDGVPINSAPLEGGSNIYSQGFDPLSTLNLSNIESIEVLKDADATAIYGSRGANGVVLITTKRGGGLNRKTEVEARWYSGLGKVSNKLDLLNTPQYLTLRRAALANDGREPDIASDYDLLLWDQDRYTDWQEELFGGTSTITDVNVFASGGNATTSFRLGGSYHKEGTVFPGDYGYHKVTGSLSLNHTSENKKLGIDLLVNYGVDHSDVFANGGSHLVSTALNLPPNAPALYNPDGSLHWEEWQYSSWGNPLAPVLNRATTDEGHNIISNLGLSYKLMPKLALRANVGYTNLDREYKGLYSKEQYSPEDRDGADHESVQSHRTRRSWIIEPQLHYSTKIGEGTLDGLVGLTFQESGNKSLSVSGEGFVSESLLGDLSAAETVRVNNNEKIRYRYNAVFARLGYNFKQRYFINLTGRRDGSSRFGPNNRFANFGAIGGAWIFSEEALVKNGMPFLSFGKLRGSYGTTGSDQIGDYGYLDAYEATSGPGGLYPTQLTNPDYSWEENKKLEAAIQLGFLKDRITLGASWYRNRSSNQLVGYPLPSTTGFGTVQANLPATVQNTGWELELSTLNFGSDNFHWRTSLNISFPRNELLEFPDIEQTSYANRYRIGHPLNIQLLYGYTGVDPDTGLYGVLDVNGDGLYDYEDRTVIRNIGRKFFGGISNTISHKALSLQFLWEFVEQDGFFTTNMPGTKSTQTVDFFEEWNNGTNPDVQDVSESFDALIAYNSAFLSERFLKDASYIRLKTLGLSYDLPSRVLHEMGVNSCRLFLQGQNLLTLTHYKGLNVEFPGGNDIPTLRTITFGAQIKL